MRYLFPMLSLGTFVLVWLLYLTYIGHPLTVPQQVPPRMWFRDATFSPDGKYLFVARNTPAKSLFWHFRAAFTTCRGHQFRDLFLACQRDSYCVLTADDYRLVGHIDGVNPRWLNRDEILSLNPKTCIFSTSKGKTVFRGKAGSDKCRYWFSAEASRKYLLIPTLALDDRLVEYKLIDQATDKVVETYTKDHPFQMTLSQSNVVTLKKLDESPVKLQIKSTSPSAELFNRYVPGDVQIFWNASGSKLCVAGTSLHILDGKTAKPILNHPLRSTKQKLHLNWSPDESTLAIAYGDDSVEFYEAATLKKLSTVFLPNKFQKLNWLSNGNAFISTKDFIGNFDTRNGTCIGWAQCDKDIEVAPDGRVYLWDVQKYCNPFIPTIGGSFGPTVWRSGDSWPKEKHADNCSL